MRPFDYALWGTADKGLLRRFLAKAAGLSRAQITRLLQQHRTTGEIADRRGAPRRPFPRRYTNADIGLLAELDVLHGTLSGPTTRKLCARAFHLFGDRRFERLMSSPSGRWLARRASAASSGPSGRCGARRGASGRRWRRPDWGRR